MKRNEKAFTLAEMLIVVAIIGVLVAIMTAVINNALEKSREAVDLANIRNSVNEVETAALADELPHKNKSVKPLNEVYYDKYSSDGSQYYCKYILATQKSWNWQSNKGSSKITIVGQEISSSIYGWSILYCISGSREGQIIINGMTQAKYEEFTASK